MNLHGLLSDTILCFQLLRIGLCKLLSLVFGIALYISSLSLLGKDGIYRMINHFGTETYSLWRHRLEKKCELSRTNAKSRGNMSINFWSLKYPWHASSGNSWHHSKKSNWKRNKVLICVDQTSLEMYKLIFDHELTDFSRF